MSDDEDKSNKKKSNEKEHIDKSLTIPILAYFIIIFLWVWIIAGIIAFIASLICFGYNGSMTDKFLGLIIVLVIGPFYWFYYIFNTNYCTREPLY